MPVQFGQWRKVENNSRGHRVRRVLQNGIEYQQWNTKYSKLVRYEPEQPEDLSSSESGEESEEADPEVPRSSGSHRQPDAGRHARSLYDAAAAAGSPAEEPTADRHFEYGVEARSQSRSVREVAKDAIAGRHVDLDLKARSRSRPPRDDARITDIVTTDPSRHAAPLTKFVSAPVTSASQHLKQIIHQSTTVPASFESSLSDKCYSFAEIRRGNLSACRAFMLANPDIAKVEHKNFLIEAAKALQADLVDHPESCIEKAVLISECAELTERGMREYLSELVEEPRTRARREFDKQYTDTLNEVKRRANAQIAALLSSAAGAQAAAHASQPGYLNSVTKQSLGPVPNSGLVYRPSFSGPVDPQYTNHALRVSTRHEIEDRANSRRYMTSMQPPPFEPTRRAHMDMTAGLTQDFNSLSVQPDLRGQPSIPSATEIEIKGTDGEEEKLDPRYKKRRDARGFFSEGRVFAMLWHENAGMSEKPGKHVEFVTTKGRFGERIFSHIRRMVVVRQRDGYCWCIAINTYGGLGVAKPGMKRADREAHSIIHMSDAKPTRKANELDMNKQPIGVDMAPGQELNVMSRLNFGRPHTVEWNVKVMNVGKVHEKSMPFLKAYWRNEMGLD